MDWLTRLLRREQLETQLDAELQRVLAGEDAAEPGLVTQAPR